MEAYTQPIYIAVIVFSVIAVAIFIPWCIYTYRKYGFLSFSKMIIVFSFIFYFLTALFLVLLPLPETTNTCLHHPANTVFYNLRPFQFGQDILYMSGISLSNPASWLLLVKQPSFYQAFFNFLLLMPFGMYLRCFLKERKYWKRAFFIGLALTLFYEVTQVTGIYGIYNCPYRFFDVDDLLLNCAGSLIGFFVAPVLLAMFPKHVEVVARAKLYYKKDIVKPFSLVVAFIIDYVPIQLMGVVLSYVSQNALYDFVSTTVLIGIVFMLVPLVTKGATPGLLILRLRMVDRETEQFTAKGIVKRGIAIYAVYVFFELAGVVSYYYVEDMDSPLYVLSVFTNVLVYIIALFIYVVLIVHVVRVVLSGGERSLFYDEVGKLRATKKYFYHPIKM